MSTYEEDAVCIARKKFTEVVCEYFSFLHVIAVTITKIKDDENQKKREKRKFLAIKKELFNFLIAHKKFYKMHEIHVKMENCSRVFKKSLSIIDHGNDFLKLEDFFKLDETFDESTRRTSRTTEVGTTFKYYKKEILNAIRLKQGKSVLKTQDIHQFFKNHMLIKKSKFNAKCSTYAELQDYIEQRIKDYCNSEISVENINQMSFRFQGSIEDCEDEKSCSVCLNDYETDQEVCRLPCNHFCCRVCTEKMFSTPNQGLRSNILCPICRDNCT